MIVFVVFVIVFLDIVYVWYIWKGDGKVRMNVFFVVVREDYYYCERIKGDVFKGYVICLLCKSWVLKVGIMKNGRSIVFIVFLLYL